MYKVFYNFSALLISDDFKNEKSNPQDFIVASPVELHRFLDEFLANKKTGDYHLKGYEEQNLFTDLTSHFKYVEAAGGLVQNNLQAYLFIRRFGMWDLPKGKIEKNETPEKAAIREVTEETGVSSIQIEKVLSSTFHIYPFRNVFVLKKTHWFFMQTTAEGELIPQVEEDITEVAWLDRKNSARAMQSSYRSLKENFSSFFQE